MIDVCCVSCLQVMTANKLDFAHTMCELGVVGTLDTQALARIADWDSWRPTELLPAKPASFALGKLLLALCGQELQNAHTALADAKATAQVST